METIMETQRFNLRYLREMRGLSQPDLSMKIRSEQGLEVSVATIWRAENGKGISRMKAIAIVRALGVNLADVYEFSSLAEA